MHMTNVIIVVNSYEHCYFVFFMIQFDRLFTIFKLNILSGIQFGLCRLFFNQKKTGVFEVAARELNLTKTCSYLYSMLGENGHLLNTTQFKQQCIECIQYVDPLCQFSKPYLSLKCSKYYQIKYSVYSLPGLVPIVVRGTLLSLSIFPLREVRNISKNTKVNTNSKVQNINSHY